MSLSLLNTQLTVPWGGIKLAVKLISMAFATQEETKLNTGKLCSDHIKV